MLFPHPEGSASKQAREFWSYHGGTNGGAINVGGSGARLCFEGAPTVFNNTGTSDTNQQRNVVLSGDSNEVINTTGEGLTGGVIGVYVPDGENLFGKHGIYNTPFGNYANESGNGQAENLDVFVNDRYLALRGESRDGTEDSLIYWQNVVCKLTTGNDDLLYQQMQIDVGGTRTTIYAPAVSYYEILGAVKQGSPFNMGAALGCEVKLDNAATGVTVVDPSMFALNVIQDTMIESERDAKNSCFVIAGYMRAEGCLRKTKAASYIA